MISELISFLFLVPLIEEPTSSIAFDRAGLNPPGYLRLFTVAAISSRSEDRDSIRTYSERYFLYEAFKVLFGLVFAFSLSLVCVALTINIIPRPSPLCQPPEEKSRKIAANRLPATSRTFWERPLQR